MTVEVAPCKALGRGCGTPDGWRKGGRCPRCRAAHNDDTRERRWEKAKPSDEAVAEFEKHLRAGVDLPVAAREAGIHPSKAHALLRREAALREQFAAPAEASSEQSERQNAYLMQILVHGGDFGRAVAAAGVNRATVQTWRARDPEFRAADESVRALARSRAEKNAPGLSAGDMDMFLDGLRDGLTFAAACERAGVKLSRVWSRIYSDPSFEARVREIRPKGSKATCGLKPRGQLKPIDVERLRALWASRLTVAQIAKFFEVSDATLYVRAAELGLGGRRQARA